MATPHIITVQPSSGTSGGRCIAELKTNWARMPPDPPTDGPSSGSVPETVQVLFGAEPATNVQVVSRGRVICVTPLHEPGAVDVTIKNLDDDGDPIPDEAFTKADAYTFARPSLTERSDLTRLVEALVVQLRNQILNEVSITTHTDYDEATEDLLNLTKIASMPALILIGPDLVENRFYSTNRRPTQEQANGDIGVLRVPYTVDLTFTLVGASELTVQGLNLTAAVIQFFNRNKRLRLDRDADDHSAGYVAYEMDFLEAGGEPNMTTRIGASNVRTFSAALIIRGFDLEEAPGLVGARTVEVTRRIEEVEIIVEAEPIPPAGPEEYIVPPFIGDVLPDQDLEGPFEILVVETESG